MRMSVELQRAFGLRREEAIKFRPNLADHGEYLRLQASWTKGGKPRDIPVCIEAQRALLERARALAGNGFPDSGAAQLHSSSARSTTARPRRRG